MSIFIDIKKDLIYYKNVKDVLIQLRNKNRYSQSVLAKVLGISRQTYMKYESGEVEPSVEIVRRLSKIYKVPYSYIIDNGKKAENLLGDIYKQQDFELLVAEPSYNMEIIENLKQKDFFYFNQQLEMIKNSISILQQQLQNFSESKNFFYDKKSFKSESFDKDKFFDKVGEQKIDSSFVDEFREKSKIL